MKKIIAMVLALAVICSLGIYGFAAGSVTGGDKTDAGTTELPTVVPVTADDETAALSDAVSAGDPVFLICNVDTDKVENVIPASEVQMVGLKGANSLSAKDAEAFKAAYKEVSKISDKVVKYFFWLGVPEGTIGENQYLAFLFNCGGEDVGVSVNGTAMDVVEVGDVYVAKLLETGAIAITVA